MNKLCVENSDDHIVEWVEVIQLRDNDKSLEFHRNLIEDKLNDVQNNMSQPRADIDSEMVNSFVENLCEIFIDSVKNTFDTF